MSGYDGIAIDSDTPRGLGHSSMINICLGAKDLSIIFEHGTEIGEDRSIVFEFDVVANLETNLVKCQH